MIDPSTSWRSTLERRTRRIERIGDLLRIGSSGGRRTRGHARANYLQSTAAITGFEWLRCQFSRIRFGLRRPCSVDLSAPRLCRSRRLRNKRSFLLGRGRWPKAAIFGPTATAHVGSPHGQGPSKCLCDAGWHSDPAGEGRTARATWLLAVRPLDRNHQAARRS